MRESAIRQWLLFRKNPKSRLNFLYFVRIESVQANKLDSTGAGDLWAAGFLYSHAHKLSTEEAGAIAARLGAQAVEQHGVVLPRSFIDMHK
jgi:sugar/nucleoside kinase (ribokinase family)